MIIRLGSGNTGEECELTLSSHESDQDLLLDTPETQFDLLSDLFPNSLLPSL